MKEFKALYRFIKPYRATLALAMFCMILVTTMSLTGPWMIRMLIKTVTDGVQGEANFGQISWLAGLLIGVYILRGIGQFGENYVSHYAAWHILKEIRQYLYSHLQALSLRYFQDKQTGELMSRVINDTRNFELLIAHAIPTFLVNGCMVIGVSVILFMLDVRLALYTLIPIPLLVVIVINFSKISRPLFKVAQKEIAEVNAILQDNFSGIKEIKSFTQEEYESDRTGSRIVAHTSAILKALKLSATYQPTIQFISGMGTVIVIFFGGRLALSGMLPLEDLVAFLLYLSMFYEPITALGRVNEGLQQALASAERVLEILSVQPEVDDLPGAKSITQIEGKLEFRNVDFWYDDQIPVLKNISFEIQPGETAALVGPTGVGKTTIAHLIPRFYDVKKGGIFLDGQDIRNLKVSDLRRGISFVSQDVFLFNGTVKDNILYGRPDATEEEVIAAAKTANAHQFISELSNGYETQVGERGVKLSGGQKQRISIARAILKDAPILILDEATSAVDTQTERLIQEALNRLMQNKTTVVIAHRLSTIQDANQIVVLKEGEILEKGKHDELLAKGGLYSELCQAQSTGRLVG